MSNSEQKLNIPYILEPYIYPVRPVPASTLIYLKRAESSSALSNMLHPGRIQVRKSDKTEK
jgi:hypothetical protein